MIYLLSIMAFLYFLYQIKIKRVKAINLELQKEVENHEAFLRRQIAREYAINKNSVNSVDSDDISHTENSLLITDSKNVLEIEKDSEKDSEIETELNLDAELDEFDKQVQWKSDALYNDKILNRVIESRIVESDVAKLIDLMGVNYRPAIGKVMWQNMHERYRDTDYFGNCNTYEDAIYLEEIEDYLENPYFYTREKDFGVSNYEDDWNGES